MSIWQIDPYVNNISSLTFKIEGIQVGISYASMKLISEWSLSIEVNLDVMEFWQKNWR